MGSRGQAFHLGTEDVSALPSCPQLPVLPKFREEILALHSWRLGQGQKAINVWFFFLGLFALCYSVCGLAAGVCAPWPGSRCWGAGRGWGVGGTMHSPSLPVSQTLAS
jgi:hypothetical protein